MTALNLGGYVTAKFDGFLQAVKKTPSFGLNRRSGLIIFGRRAVSHSTIVKTVDKKW